MGFASLEVQIIVKTMLFASLEAQIIVKTTEFASLEIQILVKTMVFASLTAPGSRNQAHDTGLTQPWNKMGTAWASRRSPIGSFEA